MQVCIRPLEYEEIPRLARSMADDPSEAQLANRWRDQEMGYRRILVAEADGVLVGTVSYNPKPEEGHLHLFALDVAPAWRNRGIGTRLVEHVVEEARHLGLDRVQLEVRTDNRARRLYHRLGFRRVGGARINTWYRFEVDGRRTLMEEPSYRMVRRVR